MVKKNRMAARKSNRQDPMDRMIEKGLMPGAFIPWDGVFSLVSDLRSVEEEIAKLIDSDPARAVILYETFMAGCNLRAEDLDDSDGDFGTFAGSLFLGWIKARQAAGADPSETATLLLARMNDDDYGFLNDLERSIVKVLDRAGLQAFEREIRARFDLECAALAEQKGPEKPNPYPRDHWGGMLRFVYAEQRDIGKYLDLSERTQLTQADCETVANMLLAKRKPGDALVWVERGLGLKPAETFRYGASFKLSEMRRALLLKLNRGGESLDSAWADFQADPGKDAYQELMRYVPKSERTAWREKAMAAAEDGKLDSMIELWLSAKEFKRLAERLARASDKQLEGLSHYVTEPAAERLAKPHPDVAARVFRALCMRIVNAGKSQYYYAALSSLEKAKSCYQRAGLDAQWQALSAEIRRQHHRKSGFMPGFERIVREAPPSKEPSFLDRARDRWAKVAKA
jgi:hypothetical protein